VKKLLWGFTAWGLASTSVFFVYCKLLLSIFSFDELTNVCFFSLRWPVRTVSFNHTGEFIAYASEDPFIDIVSDSRKYL
jgi:hypothetical protein